MAIELPILAFIAQERIQFVSTNFIAIVRTINLCQQPRRKRQLITLIGQRQRLHLAQKQWYRIKPIGLVIRSIERLHPLDRTLLYTIVHRHGLISNLCRRCQISPQRFQIVRKRDRQARHFIGTSLDRHPNPIPVHLIGLVRYLILRIGNEPSSLLRMLGHTPGISNTHRLQHITKGIHLQRHLMPNARVCRVALIVVGQTFPWMHKEHCMAIPLLCLHPFYRQILFRHTVGMLTFRRAIIRIDLLPQHRTL